MPPADDAPTAESGPSLARLSSGSRWPGSRSPGTSRQAGCGHEHPLHGAWLPALPFGEWFNWQRDLARRLAAAALAADKGQGSTAGVMSDPDAGGRP